MEASSELQLIHPKPKPPSMELSPASSSLFGPESGGSPSPVVSNVLLGAMPSLKPPPQPQSPHRTRYSESLSVISRQQSLLSFIRDLRVENRMISKRFKSLQGESEREHLSPKQSIRLEYLQRDIERLTSQNLEKKNKIKRLQESLANKRTHLTNSLTNTLPNLHTTLLQPLSTTTTNTLLPALGSVRKEIVVARSTKIQVLDEIFPILWVGGGKPEQE